MASTRTSKTAGETAATPDLSAEGTDPGTDPVVDQNDESTKAPSEPDKGKPIAVKYVGTADIREISAAAWKNVDVTDQGLVRWHRGNGFQVSAEDLSEGALRYCDELDDHLVVVRESN